MRPLILTLKGFLGIRSGKAKNEVTIDFSSVVPSSAQMVAITGPNGTGKTTLMDNMHPYRVMPSRASSPTPTSFSFYDHIAEGPDGALKDLTWEHGGKKYQSVVRIRQLGKTRKQEAYLFEIGSDGQQTPYCNPKTGLSSDGKAEVYDRCVEEILGKPEVFFAAIFSAQNKKPVQSMTATEVKTLLASMLGMDGVKLLGAKSSEVQKGVRNLLADIQSKISELSMVASIHAAKTEELRLVQNDFSATSKQIAEAKIKVEQAVSALAVANENRERQASLIAQRASLQSSLDSANENMQRQLAAFDQGKSDGLQAFDQTVNGAQSRVDELSAALNDFSRKLSSGNNLLAGEDDAKRIVGTKDARRSVLANKRNQLEDLSFSVARLNEVRASLSSLQDQLSTERSNGQALKAEIDSISAIAELVDKVPCSGMSDLSSRCQLLESSCAAKAEIPQKQILIQNLRGKYERTSASAKTMNLELQKLLEAEEKSNLLSREIAAIELEMANIKAAEVTLERIEEAKREKTNLQNQIALDGEKLNAAKQSLANAIANRQSAVASIQRERTSLQNALLSGVKSAQDSLASLPLPVSDIEVSQAETKVATERNGLALLEAAAQKMTRLSLDLETAISKLDDQIKQLAELNARKAVVENELSQWILLSQALSVNGIIAMTIDDAGPQISAICNSLLEECYGGRFLVRLSTQSETATGVQKESFEIHVEDTLRGESKLLGDMSGGEKVWINECLVRAIALHMGQSASVGFKTLFSDESDGPLDETRKRQFMDMKRAVLKRGGYQCEYLITQTPALWEMCDAVINVADL